MKRGLIPTYQDRLVIRYGAKIAQGKRVAATCKLTLEERQIYVHQGSVKCVHFIMDTRNYSIAQAWELLKQERGYTHGTE